MTLRALALKPLVLNVRTAARVARRAHEEEGRRSGVARSQASGGPRTARQGALVLGRARRAVRLRRALRRPGDSAGRALTLPGLDVEGGVARGGGVLRGRRLRGAQRQ